LAVINPPITGNREAPESLPEKHNPTATAPSSAQSNHVPRWPRFEALNSPRPEIASHSLQPARTGLPFFPQKLLHAFLRVFHLVRFLSFQFISQKTYSPKDPHLHGTRVDTHASADLLVRRSSSAASASAPTPSPTPPRFSAFVIRPNARAVLPAKRLETPGSGRHSTPDVRKSVSAALLQKSRAHCVRNAPCHAPNLLAGSKSHVSAMDRQKSRA